MAERKFEIKKTPAEIEAISQKIDDGLLEVRSQLDNSTCSIGQMDILSKKLSGLRAQRELLDELTENKILGISNPQETYFGHEIPGSSTELLHIHNQIEDHSPAVDPMIARFRNKINKQ